MDTITAFLNGVILGDHIYIKLPDGYSIDGIVNLFKRGLYSLKQSLHLWQETLTRELQKLSFYPIITNSLIFITDKGIKGIILITYINNFLIASSDVKEINIFKG